MIGRCWYLLALLFLILASPCILAQTDRAGATPVTIPEFRLRLPRLEPAPGRAGPLPPGIRFALPELVRPAGAIFSGAVTNIEHRTASGNQTVETVAITFHIERAIRGATPGSDLTVTQWIGLWASGQRYRLGEHVLLFLYPPSKLGLTSCVAGSMGRFDVDAWGRVELSARHLSMLRKDPVLGGRSRVSFSDFALAVRRAGEEEVNADGGDHEN
jgi:hypothetical protein